ncbi:MAG: hypothetical protein Q8L48_27485 [Archangium sp.]|nr:hypothetical protein [Archangium sp.]
MSVLSFTGCPEDMSTEKATWDTTTKGWADRMDKMKKGHDELAAKVKAFTVPESEAALVADKADLTKAVETGTTAITAAEHEMQTAKTTIEKLISNGKKVQVEVALGTTKSTVDGTLARAESMVSSANSALETLTKKVAAAKASGDAAKSRTDAWLNEVKKKGAAIIVDDLVFAGEGLDADKSKVALSSLVATLKSCADLKVELTVVALGEATDLGTKRAEALKTYLTTNGVNVAVLAKVAGSAVKEGEEKVSFAVTTPCK